MGIQKMTSLFIKFTIEPSPDVSMKQEIIATITGHRKVTDKKNKPVSECWSLNCPQILIGGNFDQEVAVQQTADLYKKEGEFFLSVNSLDITNNQSVHHIPIKNVQYTTGIFVSLK